jgi:hypothetical protein
MGSCILAGCIVVALAGGSGPGKARAASEAATPSRLEQGEAALARGEFRQAAEEFAAHYHGLPAEQRASQVGEHVVMYAADVYDKAWAQDTAIEDLEASRALLSAFLRDVESIHGTDEAELTAAARAKIEDLDAKIDEASAEAVPPADPVPKPEVQKKAIRRPKTVSASPHDTPGPDPLGIALLASGATIAAGGIAMLAAGLAGATTRRARARIDDRCQEDGVDAAACDRAKATDEARAFIADAERSDRTIAFVSIAPLVVGTALLIGGGVRVALRRRHESRIGWGTWVRGESGGAYVSGRF